MSHSGDVDKMLSDFLSELNALSDSIGTRQDRATPGCEPEQAVIAPVRTTREPPEAEQEDTPSQPLACKPVHYRNIDILLMDDAEPASGSASVGQDEFRGKTPYRVQFKRVIRAARGGIVWAAASFALLCLAGVFFRLDPFGLTRSVTNATPGVAASVSAPGQGSIRPATPMDRIVPAYPSRARRLGISGTVDVRVEVDENGRVVRALPVRGPSLLRSAAAQAVAKCRFRPARRDGINLKSTVEISVAFNP